MNLVEGLEQPNVTVAVFRPRFDVVVVASIELLEFVGGHQDVVD